MEQDNVLKFANYRLWCLVGNDLAAANAALAAHKVDGIFISQGRGFAEPNLDCLARIPGLAILAIGDADDVDISAVSELVNLEFLSISYAAGTVQLAALTRLRHLRLTIAKGWDLPAAGLPVLNTLAVWNYRGSDLSFLANFPAMTHLEITQAGQLATLDGLAHAPGLLELDIAYCPRLQDIGALGSAAALRKLELMNIRKVDSYAAIAALTCLKRLVIEKAAPLPSLDFLRALTQLESVVLRKVAIGDNDLSPLLQLPALSHVYLDRKKEYGTQVKEIEAAAAQRAPSR